MIGFKLNFSTVLHSIRIATLISDKFYYNIDQIRLRQQLGVISLDTKGKTVYEKWFVNGYYHTAIILRRLE